jgi:glycosyltransferase involved in cell wall biosynthesis
MLEQIKRHVPVIWIGHNGDIDYFKSYDDYRAFLASTLIYVHCGTRSPMPGGRTEAMLSGCCIVTTSNQDADRYIVHGETGFLCDTADDMARTIKILLRDPHLAYTVGKRGREAAREFFNKERYVTDWLSLIAELRDGPGRRAGEDRNDPLEG